MKPWVAMWVYAFAMYLFFKILSWPRHISVGAQLIYLFAWPGMDSSVLQRGPRTLAPAIEWLSALAKTLFGISLLWILPRHLPVWAQGWSGMFGLIFVLHFGIFHLIALLLRANGYAVRRIMNAPLLATSIADFWGKRWNMAFRDLAHSNVFSRLAMKFGAATAIVATFFFSGLLHEIVISLPVMRGFGGPTLYFVIQALGMLIERRALKSRAFTLLVVLLPAPLLFHEPLLEGVMIPFLHAIGGLP